MDFINFIPPSDYYTVEDESEEQMEDVAYQYGDIEKIIDFDSVTEIPKVDTSRYSDISPSCSLSISYCSGLSRLS